jgi:hypothetical protein
MNATPSDMKVARRRLCRMLALHDRTVLGTPDTRMFSVLPIFAAFHNSCGFHSGTGSDAPVWIIRETVAQIATNLREQNASASRWRQAHIKCDRHHAVGLASTCRGAKRWALLLRARPNERGSRSASARSPMMSVRQRTDGFPQPNYGLAGDVI